MSQQAGQGLWLRTRPDADRGCAPGPTLTVVGPLLEATSGTHRDTRPEQPGCAGGSIFPPPHQTHRSDPLSRDEGRRGGLRTQRAGLPSLRLSPGPDLFIACCPRGPQGPERGAPPRAGAAAASASVTMRHSPRAAPPAPRAPGIGGPHGRYTEPDDWGDLIWCGCCCPILTTRDLRRRPRLHPLVSPSPLPGVALLV